MPRLVLPAEPGRPNRRTAFCFCLKPKETLMAVKLSVGFQKKSGLPNYGSLGARCDVEFEIDPSLLQSDLEGFHEKARRAFSACQQAVNDQLARSGANGFAAPANGQN